MSVPNAPCVLCPFRVPEVCFEAHFALVLHNQHVITYVWGLALLPAWVHESIITTMSPMSKPPSTVTRPLPRTPSLWRDICTRPSRWKETGLIVSVSHWRCAALFCNHYLHLFLVLHTPRKSLIVCCLLTVRHSLSGVVCVGLTDWLTDGTTAADVIVPSFAARGWHSLSLLGLVYMCHPLIAGLHWYGSFSSPHNNNRYFIIIKPPWHTHTPRFCTVAGMQIAPALESGSQFIIAKSWVGCFALLFPLSASPFSFFVSFLHVVQKHGSLFFCSLHNPPHTQTTPVLDDQVIDWMGTETKHRQLAEAWHWCFLVHVLYFH